MRWIKHMTNSNRDEKMTDLLNECGHEGYGFFWLLCEVIGEAVEKGSTKCSLTHPLTQWSRLLYCHHNRVGKYIGKLQVIGLCEASTSGGKLTIKIPNLLKYRDEYTSRGEPISGQTPDTVPSKIQIQKQSIDTDKTTTPPYPPSGEENELLSPREPSPPEETPEPQSEVEAEVAREAAAMTDRHPAIRSCSTAEARKLLRKIVNPLPLAQRIPKIREIGRNHREWCGTDQWQKDGGEYAKSLPNWLAPTMRRYDQRPPQTLPLVDRAPPQRVDPALEIIRQKRAAAMQQGGGG